MVGEDVWPWLEYVAEMRSEVSLPSGLLVDELLSVSALLNDEAINGAFVSELNALVVLIIVVVDTVVIGAVVVLNSLIAAIVGDDISLEAEEIACVLGFVSLVASSCTEVVVDADALVVPTTGSLLEIDEDSMAELAGLVLSISPAISERPSVRLTESPIAVALSRDLSL